MEVKMMMLLNERIREILVQVSGFTMFANSVPEFFLCIPVNENDITTLD